MNYIGGSARQIRMIALGGTIGVGFYLWEQLVQLNGLVHQLFLRT